MLKQSSVGSDAMKKVKDGSPCSFTSLGGSSSFSLPDGDNRSQTERDIETFLVHKKEVEGRRHSGSSSGRKTGSGGRK